MKKILTGLLVIAIAATSLTGCAKSLRYSHDEIKDFPPAVQDRIKNGEVAIGMTKLQVRYAWGGPDLVTVLAPAEGGKERVEWLYKRFQVFRSRIVFTDDKVTEIISSEPGLVR